MNVVTTRTHRYGGAWSRTVASYAAGTHWPTPVLKADGWRCSTCLGRLRPYNHNAVRRLRHYRAA